MRTWEIEIINDKSREDWLRLFKSWVHSERDRQMLERYLLDKITIEHIAEEFEMSVNYCQSRISLAKKQLFKNM